MKTVILALFSVLLAFSSCHAESATDMKKFIGAIDSVAIDADESGGNRAQITAISADGRKMTFTARSGIGVTGYGTERVLNLSYLRKGDDVTIGYMITKDGIPKALEIELKRYRAR